jgi:hypothetical protein
MDKRVLFAIVVMSLIGFAPAPGQATSLVGATGQAISPSDNGVTLAAVPPDAELEVWEAAYYVCRHYRNAQQRHACEQHYIAAHPYVHPHHHRIPGH